jgi:hypothetical protein
MSPFKITIQKGDRSIIENQGLQTQGSGVYLCVGGNCIATHHTDTITGSLSSFQN